MPQTEELSMSTDMMVFPPTQLIRICNKFEKNPPTSSATNRVYKCISGTFSSSE